MRKVHIRQGGVWGCSSRVSDVVKRDEGKKGWRRKVKIETMGRADRQEEKLGQMHGSNDRLAMLDPPRHIRGGGKEGELGPGNRTRARLAKKYVGRGAAPK